MRQATVVLAGDLIMFLGLAAWVLAQPAPAFKLGFQALADQIPEVVGQPIENEHWGSNGDSLQQTSKGLMVWRKTDNWTAFTNGDRTWVNGSDGVQERSNVERFGWESSATASTEAASPQAQTGASMSSPRRLTPADVGLPIDPGFYPFKVKPCFIYNDTNFHNGDLFLYNRLPDGIRIPILAPIDGLVDRAYLLGNGTGFQVNVTTEYLYTNRTGTDLVRYDMFHMAELDAAVHPGAAVKKGQIIGYLTNKVTDPGGNSIIDIALRNTREIGAEPAYPEWLVHRGYNFFAFLPFVEDDLQGIPYSLDLNCKGSPYPK